MEKIKIALAGNPNVGKSTVFNALTGMHQHTGNWAGKTVTNAVGRCTYDNKDFEIYDLPGAYSLNAESSDEEAARDFILSGEADAVVVVCDASCLERNLCLALQIMNRADNVVLCLNLMDEAKRRGVRIDTDALERELNIPVVSASARSGQGVYEALDAVKRCDGMPYRSDDCIGDAAKICQNCVISKGKFSFSADKILTGRFTAFPVMIIMAAVTLWLTIKAANYPSQLLSDFLGFINDGIKSFLLSAGVFEEAVSFITDGVLGVSFRVISVMLPPMAIFFPMFTFLEDLGYLPRVAFNLDRLFCRCHACGKQALTMCMGLGCNAVGVTGCRIISSPREKLIAILTNSFIPCNGRFPTLIAIIVIFFASQSGILCALILMSAVLLSVGLTFLSSYILSKTVLKGEPSSFVLELPPYRRPQVLKVIVRSILDRTLFVLGRAVTVAAPAGAIIWVLANVRIGDTSILLHVTSALDPVGRFVGLDGCILTAFILGLPANEIVLPIALMAYSAGGTLMDFAGYESLKMILVSNGWTAVTAVCMIIFTLLHWPCSTTLLTVYKETGSVSKTILAFLLPTVFGIAICAMIAHVF